MKRIYFTSVPLDSNFTISKKPLNLMNFQMNTAVTEYCYPIIPILAATAAEGDEIKVVTVRQKNSLTSANYGTFLQELEAIGFSADCVSDVCIPETQEKDILLGLFEELIPYTEDESAYYADITFGAKTMPIILFSVLEYADKIRSNTTIKGIYYQEVLRRNGKMTASGLYDVTALFSMNALMHSISYEEPEQRIAMMDILLHPESLR